MRRRLRRLRDRIFPPRPMPRDLPEAIEAIGSLRTKVGELRIAVLAMALAAPSLTWLVLTVGERERDHNCRVTEHAIGEQTASIGRALAVVSADTADELDELQDELQLFLEITSGDLSETMEGCG